MAKVWETSFKDPQEEIEQRQRDLLKDLNKDVDDTTHQWKIRHANEIFVEKNCTKCGKWVKDMCFTYSVPFTSRNERDERVKKLRKKAAEDVKCSDCK